MNLIYRKNAFDHFDAVQATSVYQYKEMKEIIKKSNLKTKVFKSEYLFVKKQITKIKSSNFEIDLLIAPSWNSNFYITNCHLILNKLLKEYKISFNDVSFAYETDKVLNKISFNIKKGEKIALIGPSGSGKSTIIDLLSKFYKVQTGEIQIDGKHTTPIASGQ